MSMAWWGRFFSSNRLGRWLNIHFHGFIHKGKGGYPYALRLNTSDISCFICRSVWAMLNKFYPDFIAEADRAAKEADDNSNPT